MALQKQPVSIVFNQGVQTKVDPFQLPIGAFASLQNAIFTKDGLLQKRNGYSLLTSAPTGATTLCTLNQGLVLLGQTCESFSEDNGELVNAGVFQPCDIHVKPIVRYAESVWQMDSTLAANGLVCTVFFNSVNSTCYYNVVDSDTGQVIVPPTLISGGSWPRCEAIGNSFVIMYVSGGSNQNLNYFLVPFANPLTPSTPVLITSMLFNQSFIPYDSTTFSNNLYIQAICNDVGGATRVWKFTATQLDQGNVPVPAVITSTDFENMCQVFITIDSNNGFPIIWGGVEKVGGSSNSFLDVFALNNDLTSHLGVTLVTTFSDFLDHPVAISSSNTVLTTLYNNTDGSLAKRTITLSGTVSSETVVVRGVTLVSKSLESTTLGKTVFLAAWGNNNGSPTLSTPQPTNFLIDEDGNVLARLAQNNAYGAFQFAGLPKMQEMNSAIYVSYLYADITTSVTSTDTTSTNAVAAQYGVNLAQFSFQQPTQGLEIGNSLHASGGFLWQYDGQKIVEHGFHLFPDGLSYVGSSASGMMSTSQSPIFYVATYEWTDAAGLIHRSAPSLPLEATILTPPATFTGTSHTGTGVITGISDTSHMQIGQAISGPDIPPNTFITGIGSSAIDISNHAVVGHTGATFSLTAVTSLNVVVPTYRLTYRTDNKVRIVIYRWTTTQQTYHQITDINAPLLNDTTVDSVTFTDTFSDAQIAGNNVIYTSGGVIENIPAPGSPAMTLWQSRLFMVDAEDRNLIWFSKPVIEATPVEMSDAFTLFIAPTTGAQGSTGDITALFSMDDKLIVFKKDAMYYITGTGPDITGANNSFSDPIFITGTVGCDNPRSLVLTPMGVMFQSDKGIWLLGRDLQTSYVGAAVESYTQGQIVTSALCIPGTNQVRFTLDNLTSVMYDYFFQRWSNWNNINAVSSVVYTGVQAYLNTFNQVVVETPGIYKDLSHKVLLSLTTGWINLAGLQGFERFYQLFLLGQYLQPFALQVQLAYDYNPSPTQSTIVTPEQAPSTWGSEAAWGTGGPWGNGSNAFEARVFPNIQKCESFQVTINELSVAATNDNGAGLTLSGMNLLVGTKRAYRTQAASRSFGK